MIHSGFFRNNLARLAEIASGERKTEDNKNGGGKENERDRGGRENEDKNIKSNITKMIIRILDNERYQN